MKTQDAVFLFVAGLIVWTLGTVYYWARGVPFLETTSVRYWVNFFLPGMLSAAICVVILRWRRVAPAHWASAMLLLAIPGMIGEAVVLSHLATFMPRLQASLGGRYGAFLFTTYALVLGVAEVVTLRARG